MVVIPDPISYIQLNVTFYITRHDEPIKSKTEKQ